MSVSDSPMTAGPEVLVRQRGRVGHLSLNRPRALNALTHGMIVDIRAALEAWRHDDRIATVVLTGEGDRGLCAGGDVVSLVRSASAGDFAAPERFFRDEYRLDAAIAHYPKPFAAILDGIVLGGGIGLAGHSSHRIVTERSTLGMPETTIGFAPDVGAAWLFAHAPGELGTFLALTGRTVGAADAILLGLADAFVTTNRLAALLTALETDAAQQVIDSFAEPAPAGTLSVERHWIDEVFAGDDAALILDRLARAPGETAATAAGTLARNSPTAIAIALAGIRRAQAASCLEDVLRQDYRMSLHGVRSKDFGEGIQAQLIRKDRAPKWSPATIREVDPAAIASYFALPADGDLTFD